MATTAYLTINEAQEYFDERLNTYAWDEANDIDKLKALKQATRKINNLRFSGTPTTITQSNQFPRNGEMIVPQDVLDATCELALVLLDDVDPNLEIENLGVVSQSYAQARTGYERNFVLAHIRAGIPSAEAWELLVPYLADPLTIRLRRGT